MRNSERPSTGEYAIKIESLHSQTYQPSQPAAEPCELPRNVPWCHPHQSSGYNLKLSHSDNKITVRASRSKKHGSARTTFTRAYIIFLCNSKLNALCSNFLAEEGLATYEHFTFDYFTKFK